MKARRLESQFGSRVLHGPACDDLGQRRCADPGRNVARRPTILIRWHALSGSLIPKVATPSLHTRASPSQDTPLCYECAQQKKLQDGFEHRPRGPQ